jgi:Protein of unknown function (DUF2800)
MSHARVMPSALHLTVPCPGSLQLQELVVPTPPTEEQAEGELGHLVALKHAQGFKDEWPVGRKYKIDRHEFELDDDMIDGAAIYADEAQPGGRYEQSVFIPDVHPTECFGTPDYWRYILETYLKLLKVIDYKYGHRFVEVFEHYQLIAYAAGVARLLSLPLDFPVKLVIVQPRNYTHGAVREWTTTVGDIYRICAEKIAPRVELALGPTPPTYVGRHCLDCKARHACKTLQVADAHLADFAGTAEIHEMPREAVGAELRILADAIKILEARYKGLYEQASHLARGGFSIAHWGLQPGQGRLKWKDNVTPQTVASMGDLFGLDLRKPMAVKTPTQCIQAGVDKSIIEGDYAERPPGAMKLTPDDTTRTRKIFGGNLT